MRSYRREQGGFLISHSWFLIKKRLAHQKAGAREECPVKPPLDRARKKPEQIPRALVGSQAHLSNIGLSFPGSDLQGIPVV